MQTAIREIVQPESWILDPSLVLYLPLYKRDGLSFMSDDAYGHLVTRTPSGHLHFTGSDTSNVNMGAIHNASAKFWISLWFKLDQDFSSTNPANLHLLAKFIDGNNAFVVKLNQANGGIDWYYDSGGVRKFLLSWDAPESGSPNYWAAGQWYHILASIGQATGGGAGSDGARLRVDNGAAVTNADVTAIPNGGDFIVGDYADPGVGAGFIGEIKEVVCGVDDLSPAEETDLYNGILPGDETEYWPMDEGTGSTVYDREGTAPADGTIDSAPTWGGPMHWRPNGHYFDGFDDYIDCGDFSGFFPLAGLTLMAWVKPDDPTPEADKGIFGLIDGALTDGFFFRLQADGSLQFYGRNASVTKVNLNSGVTLLTGDWQLIGVTWVSGSQVIYIDGLEKGTDTDIGVIGTPSVNLTIGTNLTVPSWEGYMGEVLIYNRALTPLEIQGNYLATKDRYR